MNGLKGRLDEYQKATSTIQDSIKNMLEITQSLQAEIEKVAQTCITVLLDPDGDGDWDDSSSQSTVVRRLSGVEKGSKIN